MNVTQLLDRFNSGGFIRPVPTETEFKQRWLLIPAASDAFTAALHGGFIADRLSWVFLAAYQSAVRACFPSTTQGCWSSFAVSEDHSGEFPGTSLVNGKLSGNKSWIAAAANVDEMLVTIGPELSGGCVKVNCRHEAITLTLKDKPGFLCDMSQGFAHFNHYPIADSDFVDTQRAKDFILAEPFFVMTAACGLLLQEAQRLNLPRLTEQTLAMIEPLHSLYQQGFASDLQALHELYQNSSEIGKAIAAEALAGDDWQALDWRQNGRLLGLYGRSLRARITS